MPAPGPAAPPKRGPTMRWWLLAVALAAFGIALGLLSVAFGR
jgi:hypothetical protein